MSWLDRISPCLREARLETSDADWVAPLRVIYDHELVVFEDGNFVMEIDRVEHDFPDGSFAIIPPGLLAREPWRFTHGGSQALHAF